jgi:hypothetical protein
VATRALETLEQRALDAARVDWSAWHRRLAERITRASSLADAHAFIREVLAALEDPHTRLVVPAPPAPPPESPAASPPAKAPAPAPAAPRERAPRPAIPALPEAAVLGGGVGYLMLPPCTDASADHVRAYASALARGICAVRPAVTSGWIVDLRLNGGGTMWPMLHGLERLLGDGEYGSSVGREGARSVYGVSGGIAWLDRGAGREPQLDAPQPEGCPAAVPARIALLIGPWTMSSGEIVAAAFARAPTVRRFGEPTAGMATATEPFPLPDGSQLVIATEAIRDGAGRPLPRRMVPDESVEWGEWPRRDDAAALAAMRWILERQETTGHGTPPPDARPAR